MPNEHRGYQACPDCSHLIRDHTTRVGENGRVCVSCDCYRYSGEALSFNVVLKDEWYGAR